MANRSRPIVPVAPSTGIVKETIAAGPGPGGEVQITSQISFKGGKIRSAATRPEPAPVLIADACSRTPSRGRSIPTARPPPSACLRARRGDHAHADSIKPQLAPTSSRSTVGSSGKACRTDRFMALSGTVTAEEIPTTGVLPALLPPVDRQLASVKGLRDMGLVPWACFIKNEPFRRGTRSRSARSARSPGHLAPGPPRVDREQ